MTLILNGTVNSATAPPIQSDVGGSTTGMFLPTTNVWAVSTDGSERLRVDASGNMGIGTASPGARLEVLMTRTSSTSGVALYLNDNVSSPQTDGVYKSIRSGSNGGVSVSEIRFLETDGTNNNTGIAFATQSTASALTERMRINTNGNVGIGTTAPSTKLDVNGTITGTSFSGAGTGLTGTASININGTVGATTATTGSFTSLAYSTTLTGGSGIVNLGSGQFYKDASGNVGIGTTSPTVPLYVVGGSTTGFTPGIITQFTNSVNSGCIQIGSAPSGSGTLCGLRITGDTGGGTSYDTYRNVGGSPFHAFFVNASEKMRIDASGNVGIGTSSPVSKLHVAGTFTITGAGMQIDNGQGISAKSVAGTSRQLVVMDGSNNLVLGGTVDAGILFMTSGGNERMRLDSSGNLGIGTTSPTTKLYLTATSAIASQDVLTIDGGATGFVSTNDNGTGYSIVFNGCSYNGTAGLTQKTGAAIQMLKANSWNEAEGGSIRATLVFKTSSGTIASPNLAEKMRLDNGGNLLIGTTTAYSRLTVSNGGSTRSVITISDTNTASLMLGAGSSLPATIGTDAASGVRFLTGSQPGAEGGTEIMRYNSTGLGIGTTSPAAKLHIGGNTASTVQAIFTTGVTDPDFKVIARNGVSGGTAIQGYIGLDYANGVWPLLAGIQFIRASTVGELAFTTGATTTAGEKMRLTSAGYLGIGTSSPTSALANISTNTGDAAGLTAGAQAIQWATSIQGYTVAITNSGNGSQFANGLLVKTTGTSNDVDAIVNFESGGVNRFKVTGAGNVGINSTSPRGKLDVNYNGIASVVIGNPNELTQGTVIIGQNVGGCALSLTDSAAAHLYFDIGSGYGSRLRSDADLTFNTSNSIEVMRMKATTGYVGIGTTAPQAKLDISLTGTAGISTATITSVTNFAKAASFGFPGVASNGDGVFFGMGAGGSNGMAAGIGFMRREGDSNWHTQLAFYTNNITNGADGTNAIQEKMRIDHDGNVGIGTKTPLFKLDVFGADNANLIMSRNSNGSSSIRIQSNAAGSYIVSEGAIPLITLVNSSERMRINDFGIGLGGASPTSGTGIMFPASQSASSNANTLDDYEEGTWTPNVNGSASGTFTTKVGTYVKIGKQVTIWFRCDTGNSGTGGATQYIDGLPFNVGTYSEASMVGTMGTNGPTNRIQNLLTLTANRAVLYIYNGGSQETTVITYASGTATYFVD
jgi:hypothetical protein